MGRLVFITAGLMASAALAGEPAIRREGAYWVQTLSGSEPAVRATRLHLRTRGPVQLAGTAQSEISYSLKVQVKARNEADARRLFKEFGVRITRQADSALVLVSHGVGMAELQLRCPRMLREVVALTAEGGVDVADLDGSVRCETGGGRIKAERIRGNVKAHTAGGDIQLDGIEGSAQCVTAGGPITVGVIRGEAVLETGAGDIVAQEIGGLARLSTGGGGIHVARGGNAVVASTGGGPIDVGQARGMVTARNSGGRVQVGSASGVHCESASGGIRLQNVSGSLRVSTAVGSILASLLAGQPLSDSFLTTGSGDITVTIPSNLGVTIRAENELADSIRRIISEFPGIAVRQQGGQVIAEGSLNGGGPILRIAGTGGTIFIKKQ